MPLLPHLLHAWITALLAGTVITFGVLTFGQPLLFDRIVVITLIGAAYYSWRYSKPLLGGILILLALRLVEEALWLIHSEHWGFRALIYAGGLALCYALRYTRFARITAALIVLTLTANLFWLYTGYPTPSTTWVIVMLLLNQSARHLVFTRPFWSPRYLPKLSEHSWTQCDMRIYDLLSVHVVLQALSLMEYLLRHLLQQPDWLFIYTLYPYATQALTCATLWVILDNAWQLLRLQRLDA